MKSSLSIVSVLLIICPFMLMAQNGEQKNKVTIKGKITGYQKYENASTLQFCFNDMLSHDLQKIYVAEIDTSGRFSIQVPIDYPQEFYVRNNEVDAPLFCAPGDELVLNIHDTAHTVTVTGGNRVKDNNDIKNFIKGLESMDEKPVYASAKTGNSDGYLASIKSREKRYRSYLDHFKKQYATSHLFNQYMDDYLKYETWNILLDYPGWHAQQNNIKQDSVQLSNSYYAFLQEYNMNDENILSTNHAHFLYSYYRYVIQHPKDSMNKANNYFKKRDIIPGANVLKNMILQKTSGFTKDMYLTRFYLDAIEGKQLKLFEAVYDSTDLTHSFFTNIINREYVQLQKFIANQDTKGAHLITISSTTAGNLLDTIIAPYPNKVIYIDFWATWCSPCLAEIPYSKTLQQDYRNKDVVFLFLANRCAEDAWKATIANKELTGEHILLTTDQYNTLAAELNITGIPYYVLIDKKGNITAQNAPRPSAEKEIRSQIDNLLQ